VNVWMSKIKERLKTCRTSASHSIVLSAACLLLWLAAPRPAIAQDLDLPGIRQAVEEYFASLETMEGRYRVRRENKAEAPQPSREMFWERESHDVQFAWEIESGRMLIDDKRMWYYAFVSKDEPFSARTKSVFDGAKSVRVVYPTQYPTGFQSPDDQPHSYLKGNRPIELDHGPWNLTGQRTTEGRESLLALLKNPKLRNEGNDEVDGAVCVRLSAANNSSRATGWLDPQRDYLPRRIEFESSKENKPPPLRRAIDSDKANLEFVIRTTKFQQIDDPSRTATEGKRWFPQAGRIENTHTIVDIEIAELHVNRPLTIESFQIPVESLPDGVQVVEPIDGLAGVAGVQPFTGDRQDLYDAVEKLMDSNNERLAALHQESLPPLTAEELAAASEAAKKTADPVSSPIFAGAWRWAVFAAALALFFLIVVRWLFLRPGSVS
jgi:hypothetical protein